MNFRLRLSVLMMLCACLCAALAPAAQAQEDKKAAREREALRRVQQALRDAEQENATLKADKAALEQKLAAATATAQKLPAAEKESQAASQRAAALSRELGQSHQANTDLQSRLGDSNGKLGKLGEEHTGTLHTLASRDAQIKAQQTTLMQVRTEIKACEDKNLKLYTYGAELMHRYRDKGPFEALRQADPVTGLTQAGIDNVLEEYRDKLDSQKIRQ